MYSRKGKRRIVVDDEIYYWCVTINDETGIQPIVLSVFSDTK